CRSITSKLDNYQLDPLNLPEYAAEFACYILHFLDRNLMLTAENDRKDALMTALWSAACREEQKLFAAIGINLTEDKVLELFGARYNTRSDEYGNIKEDWFAKISLRFGQKCCEVLKIPFENSGYLTVHFATQAPEVYKGLLPI